ncbi:MAG: amino acid adenylation domain-containing protein, partial [Rhodanobacter sp.]
MLSDPDRRLTPALKARLVAVREELLLWLEKHGGTRTPIVAQPPRDAWPLSFAQQRLWFIDQLEQGSAQYNIPYAFGLRGKLDVARLREALDTIVARHAVLRTAYVLHDGEPVQVVRRASPLRLDVIDLSDLDPDTQDARIAAMTEDEGGRAFDLSVDLMLRCALLRRSEDHHVVLFTMHHIASDGWSMGVLIREFVALYARGAEAELPVLDVQYADYACWQRETADGSLFDTQLAYWRRTLEGIPAVHALPLDRQRPAEQGFVAHSHQRHVGAQLLAGLHALGRARGATLFMVLQSAFAALLARFSGENDIAMAVPHAGRDDEMLAPLIGLFVNTLVFRTRVEPGMTGHDLIDQGRQVALGAFAHAYVPFDAVRDAIGHERSLAYNPLCQVKFVLQNFEASTLGLEGLIVEGMAQSADKVHFDLDLTVVESTHGLQFQWLYKEELFERSSIEQLASAYEGLLAQLSAQPSAALSALSWLSGAGQAQLLAWGQGATVTRGREAVLSRQVEAQAARTPRAIAVREGAATLDYATLEAQANRLAHALGEMGIGPGTRVGVHLERSLALPVALLAVLKSGAAYVVLDHRQPPARLGAIVADAGIAVVLLDSRRSSLPVGGLDAVYLDAVGEAGFLAGYPATPLPDTPGGEDPAYVLYTSGSTGTPKGVVIGHAGLTDYLAFAHEGYYASDLAGSLVLTSPAFDLTVPALFAPWLVGGSVELLPAQEEMAALVARLESPAAPAWLLRMTPSHAQALLALADAAPRSAAHVFVVGGEAFDAGLAGRLRAKYPAARLYNHYGPTETVVGCAWQAVSGEEAAGPLPIGRPMSNTVLYVMDGDGRLQPPGVAGELYIGGAGVALGYLNQPALSAAKFVADPWRPGQRVYRSGDRVRWRADGTLAFLGRLDDQVKLRGFRIELGDIEAALRAVPGVSEAAVVLRGEGEGARLLGYVTGQAGAEAIGQHLAAQLPAYMLPAAIVPLDGLPRTANGKLDRRALPEPAEDGDVHEAPAPGTEQALAAIWARLLGRETIGAHDHFFRLGGHSLLATRVASEIDRRFGKLLPVRALFEHPTLRALAAHVDAQAARGHAAIPVADRDGPLPLSFAQQRLWFIDRLEGGSAQYNMPAALRLRGALDVAALQRALDALLARHDVLRTTYAEVRGEGVQVIAPVATFSLATSDLSHHGEEDRLAKASSIVAQEADVPFDLVTGPLIRGRLVRLERDDHVLLVTQHHSVSDGWSLGVLVRDLGVLYSAFVEGRPDPLPALPVQYADYAAWQRERLQGEALEAQLGYWRTQLAGAPAVHGLPLDRPRPPRQAFTAGSLRHRVDRNLLDRVHALARASDASLFIVLDAVFALLLSRYSNETDIVIGTPIAGRPHKDLEGLVGFFVNTLVLRHDVRAGQSFDAFLAATRDMALTAYEHQDMPFDLLVEDLKPQRSLAHGAVVQVSFTMQNNERTVLHMPGLELESFGRAGERVQFDLQLFAMEDAGGLSLDWVYATSLFEEGTIERLSRAFACLLEAAVASPSTPVERLPVVDALDRATLAAWNAT